MDGETAKILIVGAGVAGIRAALDLAETGCEVLLTDSSPAIGGILSKLDVQFPSDHCGMCRMLPFVGREDASQFCMRKSLFHDNITILPDTEVVACEGEPGRFTVTLERKARWVDTEVCIGDGACAEVCPVELPDEFNEGMTVRKAIYRPVPQNLPNLFVIDRNACTRCGECLQVCPTGAIHLGADDHRETATVAAVVLATGTGLYDAATEPNFYGFGQSPHVVTSLGFERIASAGGTYSGTIVRPRDGRTARRLAWIQCVGSRNRRIGRDFCSSVCCMFALKEAVLAKEHGGAETETTIFYMDLRTYGRDYYRYRRAAEEKGVRLVRCRAPSVRDGGDGDPVIRYFGADGKPHEESFDLVVLATGQSPPAEVEPLARVFKYQRNEYGFVATDGETGVRTTSPGVFACGSFTGLKDINETLIQASAAASAAGQIVKAKGLARKKPASPVSERKADRERPLVEVLICRWPVSEGVRVLDFDALAEQVRKFDLVGGVHVLDEACRAGLEAGRTALRESRANRVLIAACLPYVYRQRLRDVAREAGFNSALIDVVDLRGEARRVQRSGNGRGPMKAALALLDGAVQGLGAKDPVHETRVAVVVRALVIGGGIAGMQATISLARHGAEVVLVERDGQLGGQAARLRTSLDGLDPRAMATRLADEVRSSAKVTVHLGAEVIESHGRAGDFRSTVRLSGREEPLEIHHGVTIVATGAREAVTSEYGHGTCHSVLTQEELEQGLADGRITPERLSEVVMIQCVGSRDASGRDYCSRICCSTALKNAFGILELRPDARILVLYRDMMTYGFREHFYTEARARGVLFATYDPDRPPAVTVGDSVRVTYHDEILGMEVEIEPDLLVLSTGLTPTDGSRLAGVLGVKLTEDGFFEEADYKFRPVETLKEGIYVCGTAHSPRSIPESMAMAEAAAQRALAVLSRKELVSARLVSQVRDALCARCELCVELCPFEARSLDAAEGRIVVDEMACQGCGICVAACPSNAASFAGLAERQVMANLDVQLLGQGSA